MHIKEKKLEGVLLSLISFYKKNVSSALQQEGVHCKFEPTCSCYMRDAIIKYGAGKGVIKGMYRIVRCNPFSKGGYDPVK